MTTIEGAVDIDEVQHLITEALGATGTLPSTTRLAELDAQLRAEVERLVEAVRARANNAEPQSGEWHALRAEIGRAEDVLKVRLPDGPLAGSLHVAELARRVCALRQAEGAR